jgi:hypothetical protein
MSTSLSKLTKAQRISLCTSLLEENDKLQRTIEKAEYVKRVTETHMRVMVN